MAKDTKIGRTPNDWEILKLGDSCEFKRGQPFAKSEIIKDGKKDCIHYGELFTVYSEIIRKVYSKTDSDVIRASKIGDILMPSSDVTATGLATSSVINDEGVLIGGDINIIRPIKNLNSNYLSYLINYEKKKVIRLISGTNIKHIYNRDLKTLQYAVPPLREQQKIAEILSTVDEAIEKTATIIEETRQLKKGLIQKLFTKGIGHTKFKETKIGRIPEKWNLVSLIDTAKKERYSFTGGPFGSNLKSEEYTETGIRIIQLQNIGVGRFLNKYKIYTSNEKADELKSCNIYPGDIIIAKMADPVARACIMPNDDERYLMASDGIRLSVDEEYYDRDFILFSINSTYFNNAAERHSTGTTRLRIGLSELKKLQLKIPPLSEQKKISSTLSEVDAKIEKEEATKAEMEQLKKGLMQVLLAGKVRVKA